MSIDEKSIYLVDGGDYSIYCLGYTQARQKAKEIMECDPWGGIPFVLKQPFDLKIEADGRMSMTKSTLDLILELGSDPTPVATEV
jgi:hypothetical protein